MHLTELFDLSGLMRDDCCDSTVGWAKLAKPNLRARFLISNSDSLVFDKKGSYGLHIKGNRFKFIL